VGALDRANTATFREKRYNIANPAMTVSFVSFIGKHNEPLFCYTQEEDSAEALHLQMIANSALDLVEERIEDSKSSKSSLDPFFDQLFAVDDYRVFGYLSNTKIKTIVVCSAYGDYAADSPRQSGNGQSMRELVLHLYSLYVRDMQNSLHTVSDVCSSSGFTSKVQQCVRLFQSGTKK